MRIADMDWRMVEDWTRADDRVALPIGSTEQHAGLSLATDAILAERIAVEAAEPLGVPAQSTESEARILPFCSKYRKSKPRRSSKGSERNSDSVEG